jgi:CDP-4-dehydro-6-deoxyglucose reductase
LTYLPGQYVLLTDADERVPPRSYSVANAPRPDGRISLLVTRVAAGPTSTWVHEGLRPGDEVMVSGPFGTVRARPCRTEPGAAPGAGSGLAPARALAESLLADQPDRPLTLFFSCRNSDHGIDHARLGEWDAARPSFRYLRTLTRDANARWHGHVPALLATVVGDLHGFEVFAAGPPGFVTSCAAAAIAWGADPTAVRTEEFFADPQPWSGEPPSSATPTESSVGP